MTNGATVEQDIMANGAIVPNRQREANVGVQGTVFLNIAVLTNLNPLIVTAQNTAEPNACPSLKAYLAHNDRARRHPSVGMNFGDGVA